MNREQSAMLEIIKASVFGQKIHLPQCLEYREIYNEMRAQAIVAVPFEWVNDNLVLDTKLKKQWEQSAMSQIVFQCQLLYEQSLLMELLKSQDIPVAILKGCAAAIYYPHPECRAMGDVDFLVREEDVQKAFLLMKENGYREVSEVNRSDHHYGLEKNGFSFELHYSPAGASKVQNSAYLKALFQKGMEHVEIQTMNEYEIPVMPCLQNGLVLLLHVYNHLVEGLGLRQIMDWMLFVDKNLDDEMWTKEYQPVLRKTGLETLAITVTKLCQKWLGLRTDKITWCSHADDLLCEELLEYLIEKGNFGHKEGGAGKGATVFSRGWGIVKIFKSAQKNGSIYWKPLKKHPWLLPFAWVSEIIRYTKYVLSRKNFLKSLIEDKKTGTKRMKLFRKLGR